MLDLIIMERFSRFDLNLIDHQNIEAYFESIISKN